MKTFLNILGFIWLLPATLIVWVFYVLPLIVFGNIKFECMIGFVAKFRLVEKENSWYTRAWEDWWGWSGPCVYIYKELTTDKYPSCTQEELDEFMHKNELHELRHCNQQFVFGATHYIIYLLVFVVLWVYSTVTNSDIHPYHDHPYEVDARKAAGQKVKVSRNEWMHGPNDRNPWF